MYIIDDIHIHLCSFLENKVYFSISSSSGGGDDCASSGYRSYSIHVHWVSEGCTKNQIVFESFKLRHVRYLRYTQNKFGQKKIAR